MSKFEVTVHRHLTYEEHRIVEAESEDAAYDEVNKLLDLETEAAFKRQCTGTPADYESTIVDVLEIEEPANKN